MKKSEKVDITSKKGLNIKDHTQDPLKNNFDNIYQSGVGMIVEVTINEQKIIGEIVDAKATRGCTGCVTFTLQSILGDKLEVSWRTPGCTGIKRLGLSDMAELFGGSYRPSLDDLKAQLLHNPQEM